MLPDSDSFSYTVLVTIRMKNKLKQKFLSSKVILLINAVKIKEMIKMKYLYIISWCWKCGSGNRGR